MNIDPIYGDEMEPMNFWGVSEFDPVSLKQFHFKIYLQQTELYNIEQNISDIYSHSIEFE